MKFFYLRLTVLFVLFVVYSTTALAQRSNGLTVEGKVTVVEGSVEGAVIQMIQDGRRLDDYGVGADGHYKVELNYNHKFELIFSRKGNFPQKITVDTNVPQSVLRSDPKFPPFPVDINLFTEIPGIDRTFSENTILKLYYSPQVDNFISERYYNDAQIKSLIDQAILQSKMIGKEADYLSKLSRAERAELKKEYDQIIKEAEKEYSNEQFLDALDGYKAANQIFPNEQYPKDRIAEINDLLGLMMAKEEMQKALADRFDKLIANADQLFTAQKYFDASNSYNRALAIKPSDTHAKQRIAEIKDILQKQQTEQQYQVLIVRGNNAFNEMLYQEALKIFTEASQLRTNEAYPKSKIKEINDKLAELAQKTENQSNYEQAIFQAELNFEKQFYDKALTSYQNALTYKPGDPKATAKIQEIQDLMKKLANQTLYDKLIKSADKAFSKEQLAEALPDYEKALEIFPQETYPAKQITLIKQTMNAENNFRDAIQNADLAFAQKQYQQSKSLYSQALEIHNKDKHAQERIKEIDAILASLKTDEKYNNLIAQADDYFKQKQYDQAKNTYNEALAAKSGEAYPKNKIDEINSILQEIARNAQKYQQTIAKADGLSNEKKYEEAKTVYAEAGTIKPDETYPQEMMDKMDSLLQEQARLLAEKQAEEKARLEAEAKSRDENYQTIIDEADRLVSGNELVAAVSKFRAALEIKPQEQYPITRIEEIRGMISRNQEAQKAYNEAIARADKEFQQEAFDVAKTAYNEAKQAKADETYPDEMVAKIDSIVQEREQLAAEKAAAEAARLAAAQAKKDSLYNAAIAKADGLFNAKDYENARTAYRSATEVKPEETYPQQRIDEIGTLMAQLSAAQKAYEDAISRADRDFKKEAFDDAKTAYNEAKQAKADETYPDEMVAKIDSIVQARQQLAAEAAAAEAARLAVVQAKKDSLYNAAIAKADGLFNAKEYENARSAYRSAMEVKPGETYPQQRIDEISDVITQQELAQKEQETRNKNYDNAIALADKYFGNKNYKQAKSGYQQALEIKPEESYPKEQMARADSLIAQQQQDEEYRQIILAADGYFKSNSYNDAKTGYENALSIKPEEQYPKTQIAKIDDIFRKEQERALADQQATADLERRKNEIAQQNDAITQQEIVNEAGLTNLYNQYISQADNYFDNKQYNISRGWYYKAWDVKPEETYPPQRIAEINRLVGSMLSSQLDRDYQHFVDLADSTFRENQLAVARGWYNRALSVKAGETYPKNQLNEIQRLIEERLAGQSGQLFESHVENADKAFETQNYSVARFWYKKALELRPSDENVKNKLIEIDKALK